MATIGLAVRARQIDTQSLEGTSSNDRLQRRAAWQLTTVVTAALRAAATVSGRVASPGQPIHSSLDLVECPANAHMTASHSNVTLFDRFGPQFSWHQQLQRVQIVEQSPARGGQSLYQIPGANCPP